MKEYLRRVYRVPGDREEVVVGLLWEQGILGLEILEDGAHVTLVSYSKGPPRDDPVLPAMVGSTSHGVLLVAETWIGEDDWMAGYREFVAPLPLGCRYLADPREPGSEPVDPGERTLLALPARTAFGTGSHPSTRLAVELLEEVDVVGQRVLDVGCGSGVLSLVAVLEGAGFVVGFDADPAAALLAGQNALTNGVVAAFFAGELAALDPDLSSFDLALVNVLPHVIRPRIGEIVARLRAEALLVVAGHLAEEGGVVARRWRESGAEVEERRELDGWGALLLKRPGAEG